MIFEGLFRRGALDGIVFSESGMDFFLKISANLSIYMLLGTGFFLCVTRSLFFFYITYLTCIISIFGIIFEILPGKEANVLWCISLGLAHALLMTVMIWTHIQIKKTFMTE